MAREVVKAGELVAWAPVTMEMIFDAPDRDAVERVAVAMAGFRQAPISRSVTDAATWAIDTLATVLTFTSQWVAPAGSID
jgi:Na+-transporting NADH:ubiquinone oxidoreductase subunit NqrB